jgi:hypothetical protein
MTQVVLYAQSCGCLMNEQRQHPASSTQVKGLLKAAHAGGVNFFV